MDGTSMTAPEPDGPPEEILQQIEQALRSGYSEPGPWPTPEPVAMTLQGGPLERSQAKRAAAEVT